MQQKNIPAAQGGADLGSGSVGRLLFKLAVPAIVAQVINVLYNMVDRMYIGHLPEIGETALTGVGVCFPLITAISAFAALVSMGGAPRASIFLGRGDKETAEKILGNCATALVVVGVALTAVFFAFGYQLLGLFGASADTIGYAWQYFSIYLVGTIFVQASLGLNAFINAQGYTMVGMLTVVIGAVLNIILDPILMFGFDMGVAGAALATIISQAVSAAFTVWFLCSKRSYLRLKASNLRLVGKILWPSIALGLSPFVMQLTESVISICFNTQLQIYGGDIAVGAMTILSSVMQFAMLPLQGLTQGAQPITSFNFGAGKMDRVADLLPDLRHRAVGHLRVCAPAGHRHLYAGGRHAGRVHPQRAAHLYGGQPAVRRADRLPADLCGAGQGGHQPVFGGAAQDHPAGAADLPAAAGAAHRAGHGGVPGRAGGGHAGRHHHLHDVRHRVRRHGQKVEAGAKSKSRRAVSRGVPCRRGA